MSQDARNTMSFKEQQELAAKVLDIPVGQCHPIMLDLVACPGKRFRHATYSRYLITCSEAADYQFQLLNNGLEVAKANNLYELCGILASRIRQNELQDKIWLKLGGKEPMKSEQPPQPDNGTT